MEQNKTGKYLKYAIGEIVLVVIGILIALSINNWNEQRKQRQVEISYLENLKEELEINLAFLSSEKSKLQDFLQNQSRLLALHLDGVRFEDGEMLVAIEKSGWTARVDIERDVWDDIYSTGNALLFQNKELQKQISNFYTRTEAFLRLIEDLDSYRQNHRRLTKGVIPADFRINMLEAGFYFSSEKKSYLENNEDLDVIDIIEKYRNIEKISDELADMIMVTKVAIIIIEKRLDNPDDGITTTIKQIEIELNRLKN